MKMKQVRNKDGHILKVGDIVGFKCDVEQYGKVIDIIRPRELYKSSKVVLSNPNGFFGEYIGGDKETTESIDDVWKDEWYR